MRGVASEEDNLWTLVAGVLRSPSESFEVLERECAKEIKSESGVRG